ncbi:recombinase family protein [Streptomyces chryseus]|uniref:Recombinase n=1 Tax=Streptomyces chryseus TaxID=68186 RepID=A0ABQ3DEA9_9ACTN|nr:recombinase family protein [Streptomyces chryseus]GHA85271.1 recombinase [Streptomyces chryseus]
MTNTATTACAAVEPAGHGPFRAVQYLRVSTDEQRKGYGVAYQGVRTSCYIEAKGWTHVGTYTDEGVSGSLQAHARPGLRTLVEDAARGAFDVVVINEGRVAGRNARVFWRWIWTLEQLGILVAVVDGDIDTSTHEGRRELRRLAEYAELEWEAIRRRTQGGIQEKAGRGGHSGGQPRFGYRVERYGGNKESRLLPDECDAGERCLIRDGRCATRHEADTLRRARELVVEHTGNWRKAALQLNAEGRTTRSGRQWSHPNLRSRLLNEDLLEARWVFRNLDSRGERGVRLGADGRPLHGETVVVPITPLFTVDQVAELRAAVARPVRQRPADLPRYLLSGRIVSPCGRYYVGSSAAKEAHRYYRCAGKNETFPGAPVCDCSMIRADEVEQWVRDELALLVTDTDRRDVSAGRTSAEVGADRAGFVARLADLEEQIDALDQAIAAALAAAALRGTAQTVAERAVEPLREESARLIETRAEVLLWRAETDAAERRAVDRGVRQLDDMLPEERAELLSELGITVTVQGQAPSAVGGTACALAEWFRSRSLDVPVLTDSAWQKAEPLLVGRSTLSFPRRALEGILHKACTGASWPEVAQMYGGADALRQCWRRWAKSGLWELIMERLADGESVPLHEPFLLPPMEMRGIVRPGVIAAVVPVPRAQG